MSGQDLLGASLLSHTAWISGETITQHPPDFDQTTHYADLAVPGIEPTGSSEV